MLIPEMEGLLKSVKRLSQLADLRFVRLRQSHIDVTINFGVQEGGNIHLIDFPVVDGGEG